LDRKTLQVLCEANNLGYSEAALQILRTVYGGGISYAQIIDAINRKLIVLGPPSQAEEEKYRSDYEKWERQERDRLAEIAVDGENSWKVPGRTSGYTDWTMNDFARQERLRQLKEYSLADLQQKVGIMETNRSNYGLSTGQLKDAIRQRREGRNQPLTPPTTTVASGRTVPVLPVRDEYTGESLDENFFQNLWASNRLRFRKYCSTYGSEQVLARMNDSVVGQNELARLESR
jgi:hypothetical protein